MPNHEHGELTERIIGTAYQVANELGHGYLESVYHRALIIALRESGLSVIAEPRFEALFRGQPVGEFVADALVEDTVVVELKAVKALAPEHETQVINYLKATGKPIGLLINFGHPRVTVRRFSNLFSNRDGRDGRDEAVAS